MFKWSVNWQFLGEELALDKTFAKILLIAHLTLLVTFLLTKWTNFTFKPSGIPNFLVQIRLFELKDPQKKPLDPYFVALSMFTCNFIGIICARSLHY